MGNVTYVGTPFQHSFYDNPDKFVMELNIKDNIDLNKELGFDPIKMRLRSDSIFAIKNEEEIKNEINKIIFIT